MGYLHTVRKCIAQIGAIKSEWEIAMQEVQVGDIQVAGRYQQDMEGVRHVER